MNNTPRKLWRTLLCLALALLMLPCQILAAAPADPDAIVYHNLTIDPNGGAFADGTVEAKTFQLRSTGYLSAEDAAAAEVDEESLEGYLPIGYGLSPDGPVTIRLSQLRSTRFTEDTTLYVIWGKAIQMTIYANGGFLFAQTGSGYELMPDPYVTTVAAGDQMLVRMLQQLAVREKYEFGGLAYDAQGSQPVATEIFDGEECYTYPDQDVTYYIQWNGPYELSITQQPESVTAAVGETAQFTVEATGVYLTYQWQYYAGGKWVDSNMEGCNTPTLSVPVTGDRNGRTYRCRLRDRSGDLLYSDSVTLTVTTTIVTQPKSRRVPIGDTAVFTVEATGPELLYRWQFNKGGGWTDSGMTGHDTASLSVPVTAARNGQKYRCIITDANGETVTSKYAVLRVKTVITAQPKDVRLPAGETAQFTVEASGVGLTYQWQFCKDETWKDSGMSGNQTETISVPVTVARNGQKYRCIITDVNGKTVTTRAAVLRVRTVITAQPKDVTAPVGETVQFSVTASGAALTYQWQYYKDGRWFSSGMEGSKTATISVPVTAARNGQQYRCVITDANGKKTYSDAAALRVKTVITRQPKDVTASVGDTAKFTVKASGAGLTYQWQFCKDGKWLASGMDGNQTAALSVPVTKARNGQQYRCVITDANGVKTYSDAAKLIVG